MNTFKISNEQEHPDISLDKKTYELWYKQSLEEPQTFWSKQALSNLDWFKKFEKVYSGDFSRGENHWFLHGKLNASVNCLDKHLPKFSQKPAFIWVGDNSRAEKIITYQQLHEQVCRFANSLKILNFKKGDTVCLYMPMIIEAVVAMLACSRLGLIHSVVFAGFSPEALRSRIQAASCKLLITADNLLRGGKELALKKQVDQALVNTTIQKVIVVKNIGDTVEMVPGRDCWYHDILGEPDCPPEILDAEDPLFILYTSGSTGKPKGILHTQAGYLLHAKMSFRYIFDYHPEDIYWCTADIGWITGHTYGVYGPLLNGVTSILYEGVPTGPDPSHVWKIVDKYQVSKFYTAPTAIRALMAHGDAPLLDSKRDSLKILGTVGEPINPEAWRWYHEKVGNKKCFLVDTWWQTETGGICLSSLPYFGSQKPGCAGKPFFGVVPEILNSDKDKAKVEEQGHLVLNRSWPGQARTIFGDHQRFIETYMSEYPGHYFSGDGARKDKDGDYWIIGRVDDVMNVSGHRIGTAEIESALVAHPKVSEAAVVSVKDPIKGEVPYAFVTLNQGLIINDEIINECKSLVASEIGKFALPKEIHWAPELPKTRSGKIMRRILRSIANESTENIGDTSTLATPECIQKIIEQKPS